MSLSEARQGIADALNTVGDLNVTTKAPRQPRTRDGWVIVSRLTPAGYSACAAVFTAVVVLGSDQATAEGLMEELAIPIVNALTYSDLHVYDVSLEPESFVVDTSQLYALAITLSMEVS